MGMLILAFLDAQRFDIDDCMDAEGTTPRIGEESSLEQRPRAESGTKVEDMEAMIYKEC